MHCVECRKSSTAPVNTHRFEVILMDRDRKLNDESEITVDDLRNWMEFGCWTTLALAPFLYWVNGPSVSIDQFVVRTALVVLASVGAFGLRAHAWIRHRSRRRP
jgi:hypothetical protein